MCDFLCALFHPKRLLAHPPSPPCPDFTEDELLATERIELALGLVYNFCCDVGRITADTGAVDVDATGASLSSDDWAAEAEAPNSLAVSECEVCRAGLRIILGACVVVGLAVESKTEGESETVSDIASSRSSCNGCKTRRLEHQFIQHT